MTMTTPILMGRDEAGRTTFGVYDTILKWKTTLSADTAQSFTLPEDSKMYEVIFSFENGANVWVDAVTTAALPGSSFEETTASLNPTDRIYPKGTTISFITADSTAQIGAEIYAQN